MTEVASTRVFVYIWKCCEAVYRPDEGHAGALIDIFTFHVCINSALICLKFGFRVSTVKPMLKCHKSAFLLMASRRRLHWFQKEICLSMFAYEEITPLLTWFIKSVNSFLFSLWTKLFVSCLHKVQSPKCRYFSWVIAFYNTSASVLFPSFNLTVYFGVTPNYIQTINHWITAPTSYSLTSYNQKIQ